MCVGEEIFQLYYGEKRASSDAKRHIKTSAMPARPSIFNY
jgi:hypothetical protein